MTRPSWSGRARGVFVLCAWALGCSEAVSPTRSALDASTRVDVLAAVDAARDGTVDVAPSDTETLRVDVTTGPSADQDAGVCVDTYGDAITTTYGRLDGTLTAVVRPGSGHRCNEDTDHLHLQVRVDGATYDVAVNVGTRASPVFTAMREVALPGAPWSEGWHTEGVTLDYPEAPMMLHEGDLAMETVQALTARLLTRLHVGEAVSVFALGYADHTGAHNVHRNGGGRDGALALHADGATAEVYAFRFEGQVF